MPDIKDHRRINDTVLGPLERPALKWLAGIQPAWVTPDFMTAIGTFGALVVFAAFILSNYDKDYLWLATLGFVINWYGDSLDGTLARYRKIERPRYGYYLDHSIDAISEILVILGLGLSPFLRFDVASLLLIAYLLMSIQVYITTAVSGVFQISYIRLGPTELRVIAVLANAIVYFFGNPIVQLPVFALSLYDLIATIIAALLLVIWLLTTFRQARQLSREEEQVLRKPAEVARAGRRGRASKRSKSTLSVDNTK